MKWIVAGLLTGAALYLVRIYQNFRSRRQFEARSWTEQIQVWKD